MTELLREPLPLGRSDFIALRHDGSIYVDKTRMIFDLCRDSGKVFLARPRRFGKSLLVSTFASLFQFGIRDFKGLAVEHLWSDKAYKVIRLDFSEIKDCFSEADFVCKFHDQLLRKFRQAGFVYAEKDGLFMGQISDWLAALPPSSLVILIDEYDAPLTASLDDPALFEHIRAALSAFFLVLKSNEGCLKFFFMTGITRLKTFFPEFNFLDDISLNRAYGTLIGFTEAEIKNAFPYYLREAGQKLGLTEDALVGKLRENYGGYSFESEAAAKVFCPWSVLNFFRHPGQGFQNYWFSSGGLPTRFLKLPESDAFISPDQFDQPIGITLDELSASREVSGLSAAALLLEAGYLTIKDQINAAEVELGYPNKEVRLSIARLYADEMLRNVNRLEVGVSRLEKVLDGENVDAVVGHFNAVLNAIDYRQFPICDEASCLSHIEVLLMGAAMATDVEKHSALGRSVLEVRTRNRRWVFEFKFARRGTDASRLLAEAAEQLLTRRYGEAPHGRELIRAALVFDAEKRAFTAWESV
ncbi:AAA family ATPase [uncultured Sutterella sp.]|uniref:AAA family ATPase n=1 Tax=uncultured Sutterella sp. TaxID=286133 RepID=UPI0026099C78|nr:AAA family ATPase [uncultured Sutterella sp.]